MRGNGLSILTQDMLNIIGIRDNTMLMANRIKYLIIITYLKNTMIQSDITLHNINLYITMDMDTISIMGNMATMNSHQNQNLQQKLHYGSRLVSAY